MNRLCPCSSRALEVSVSECHPSALVLPAQPSRKGTLIAHRRFGFAAHPRARRASLAKAAPRLARVRSLGAIRRACAESLAPLAGEVLVLEDPPAAGDLARGDLLGGVDAGEALEEEVHRRGIELAHPQLARLGTWLAHRGSASGSNRTSSEPGAEILRSVAGGAGRGAEGWRFRYGMRDGVGSGGVRARRRTGAEATRMAPPTAIIRAARRRP